MGMTSAITEGVQRTRAKLRKELLHAVFNEFDGTLMKLPESKRVEKYRKMSQSTFSFFRGSAYLFYFDAVSDYFPYHTSPERTTWIQGDLHFDNFGAFRNEAGRIVYDVNDFDEGYVGSYLYDLLRMSVSITLVGRQSGYSREEQIQSVSDYVRAYYKQMHRFSVGKDDPGAFVINQHTAKGPIKKLLHKLEKRSQQHFLEKVSAFMQSERVFLETMELVAPAHEEQSGLERAWSSYVDTVQDRNHNEHHYRIKDIAVKHGSGTASIGLDRYYVLIGGGIEKDGSDDTVLEVKEVRVPIPAYFMPFSDSFWQSFTHQGKRVTATQQAMHHAADEYLGFLTMDDRHFYVRERSPYKKRLKWEHIQNTDDMKQVVALMGRLTAKMHARADADVAAGVLPYHSEHEIVKAMGSDRDAFCRHITHWSTTYADQVETDYELFLAWMDEAPSVQR